MDPSSTPQDLRIAHVRDFVRFLHTCLRSWPNSVLLVRCLLSCALKPTERFLFFTPVAHVGTIWGRGQKPLLRRLWRGEMAAENNDGFTMVGKGSKMRARPRRGEASCLPSNSRLADDDELIGVESALARIQVCAFACSVFSCAAAASSDRLAMHRMGVR